MCHIYCHYSFPYMFWSWRSISGRIFNTRDINKSATNKRFYIKLYGNNYFIYFFQWIDGPLGAEASSFLRLQDHTFSTLGRPPLDEWPARRRDLYLTTHNTHKRQTSMPLVGFEPAILVSERPQTHALDRTAPGIGIITVYLAKSR
jgi:hypothetical protein